MRVRCPWLVAELKQPIDAVICFVFLVGATLNHRAFQAFGRKWDDTFFSHKKDEQLSGRGQKSLVCKIPEVLSMSVIQVSSKSVPTAARSSAQKKKARKVCPRLRFAACVASAAPP